MTSRKDLLALTAAAVGAVVGYHLFFWIVRQGFYALVVPGALVGLAASVFKSKSNAVCVVCGVLALAVGVLAEWRFAPFSKDQSLGYFLAHLHQLRPLTLIMIALGVLIGFGVPWRNRKTDPD